MLRLALLFLLIALIAGVFNFGLAAGVALEIARLLFFVFLVLALLTFLGGLMRGGTSLREYW